MITYYRLAEYDIDGSVHFSEVKSVSQAGEIYVEVIPNPNNGTFVISRDNISEMKPRVSIVNSIGQEVYMTNEISTNLQNIDISYLSSGVYYLQVSTQEGKIVKKIVKE